MNLINSLIIVFCCCVVTVKGQTKGEFVVKGVIDTVPNSEYIFMYSDKDQLVYDTLKLDDKSEFVLRGKISEPSRLFVYINGVPRPTDVYHLWIEPDKTILFHGRSGERRALFNYRVQNSEIQRRFEEYKALMEDFRPGMPLAIEDSIERKFIEENLDSYYVLHLLWARMSRDSNDYDFVDHIMAEVPRNLRDTWLGRNIIKKSQIRIGSFFPNIPQEDKDGNIVKIADINARYLLVDFWASWCVPCRMENPFLKEAYKKYQKRGFEILGVSFDFHRDKWLEAIAKDGLIWSQVSDLKGFEGYLGKELFIRGIPDNFLLDSDGRIVARGLRGKELASLLEKLLD
ncbi:redoxin domain-containing protein [Sphingobacterium shayense]|uniref:TlpA family protein disulfide reductase n=1 Tax=Sphingobacterium shayense TaxID=626343 RepID=UPI001554488E|nr:TlpA disulfide reductase family protein [Sphingobacterium shayense]NQD70937.1 redoxin domain-containing protein [Sphingobacterium shayense]